MYYKIQVSPEVSTNKNPPAGHTGGLLSLGKSAVAIPRDDVGIAPYNKGCQLSGCHAYFLMLDI